MPTTYAIPDGRKQMNVVLYTGTNSTSQNVNGFGFQPDLVWVKNRDNVENHHLMDSVRGNNKFILSNSTAVERTGSMNSGNNALAFISDGFSITSNGTGDELNFGTRTYSAWAWKANGTAASNTSGSITSSVSANTTAGFSVVTYTGTGASNATVGHGLGVTPKLVILKARTTNSTSSEWWVSHAGLTSGYNIYLNRTDPQFGPISSGTTSGGIGTLSSTIFTLANGTSTNNNTNQTSCNYVAYCWSEVPGFSAFGNYTGNDSTDGTFVYTGFRPKFVMIKNITTSATSWILLDSARNSYNVENSILLPNDTAAEDSSSNRMDFLSNGFKLRLAGGWGNSSTATYIYMAFAENPFKYANAR